MLVRRPEKRFRFYINTILYYLGLRPTRPSRRFRHKIVIY